MKQRFEIVSFTPAGLATVRRCEQICNEYAGAGYRLTLRGLYYQLVRRDQFPPERRFWWNAETRKWIKDPEGANPNSTRNAEPNYKWLIGLMTDARNGGLLDWNHLVDEGREAAGGDRGWDSPQDAMESITRAYGITHWDDQPYRLEVWVEKQALENVVSRAASAWDVPYVSAKGYTSTSLMYESAMRLRAWERAGLETVILHLGDHDPSGVDMSRDIETRLRKYGSKVRVERIALNMDQITDDLPPAPAKITDSRSQSYIDLYGEDSWELDAMEPAVMDALIQDNIRRYLDEDLYQARLDQEEEERVSLVAIRDNWETVLGDLRDRGLLDGEAS